MQNCWNGKGKNKATQWKPMVVSRNKTLIRIIFGTKSEQRYNKEMHRDIEDIQ
jgi:phosphotransferase system IIB component